MAHQIASRRVIIVLVAVFNILSSLIMLVRAKTRDIAIRIRDTIPEPQFTLAAPANWDGRQTIEVVPQVRNLAEMQRRGAKKGLATLCIGGGMGIAMCVER